MNNHQLAEQFANTNWLARIGEPDDNAKVLYQIDYENDIDAFFGLPYAKPYETWCIAEYVKALTILPNACNEFTEKIAKKAYLAAWQQIPNPEICGLVFDDVQTILSLLAGNQALSDFTQARLNWYLKGRMPWGYQGDFATGRWIIL